jgi:hypothetical protein
VCIRGQGPAVTPGGVESRPPPTLEGDTSDRGLEAITIQNYSQSGAANNMVKRRHYM